MYDPIKWLFSIVYIYFAISFIRLEKYKPTWYNLLHKYATYSLWILMVLLIYSVSIGNNKIIEITYNFIFIPITLALSIISLYIFYKTDSPVKYYLIIGAGFYLVLTTFSHFLTYTGHPFRILFYGAITFEMIMFALGLGKLTKIYLEKTNQWQRQIILKHEENIKLKDKLANELDKRVKEKTDEIIQLMEKNEAEKRKRLALHYSTEMLSLKMQALQAQMNPHFLFNSLNSIKHFIINNEPKKSISYLTKFAKLIRNVLDNSKVEEISLKDELNLMELYLDIENMRFNGELDYHFNVAPGVDLNRVKIPPLILQALIENAIWHGLAPKKENKKLIINIQKSEKSIIIEIEDNGIGRKQAEIFKNKKSVILKKEGMGINITEERLKVFSERFKNKYKIHFLDLTDSEGNPTGTKVELIIPLHQ